MDKLDLEKEEVATTSQKVEPVKEKTDDEVVEHKIEKPKAEKPKFEKNRRFKRYESGFPSVIRAKAGKLDGPKIVEGQKIDLAQFKPKKKKPVASSSNEETKKSVSE